MPERRFLDASIFVNWLKASPENVTADMSAAVSGYILTRIEDGEEALTTITVKDEVAIWLSRYKPASVNKFLELLTGYTTLEIATPTIEDQVEAGKLIGKYPLGYSDLLSLVVMDRYGVQEMYSSDKAFDKIEGKKRVFLELTKEEGYTNFLQLFTHSVKKPDIP